MMDKNIQAWMNAINAKCEDLSEPRTACCVDCLKDTLLTDATSWGHKWRCESCHQTEWAKHQGGAK